MADPYASDIVITYNGAPIVNDGSSGVIYASARFESQNAAQPGTFEFTVRDPNRVLSFSTGKEITLSVDGVLLFGGYVTQVTRKFALPVDDTSRPVKSRQWVLRGVDYNILFDKRVLRNTSNYLERLPNMTGDPTDGEVVRKMADDYIDVPAGFDTTTHVEDIASANADDIYVWMQQGTTWREAMRNASLLSGAIWYLDADKNLIWRALENSEAKWGFSDVPNNRTVSASPLTFQGSTIGFRDADIVEDGSFIINDAFVWGGSEFTGTAGGTVFSRYDADTSITNHGRWQLAETHFGQLASQRQVDARSRVIVNGSPTELQPGSVEGDSVRGLRFSQWQVKFTWYAHDVPLISGTPDHIRPGDLTTMIFYVLGQSNSNPLIQTLPCRQIRISFPQLNIEGDSYVQFEGFFSLQPDDPYTLWSYLRANRKRAPTAVATSNDSSTSASYGGFFQGIPTPDPPSGTLYTMPNGFGYLSNTLQVFLNGILLLNPTHYTETDPAGGTFTLNGAANSSDRLWITARTTTT